MPSSIARFALPLFLASTTLAQHQTFTINPDASEVKMTLNTSHEVVQGTFHAQSGAIKWDGNVHTMSGSLVVAARTARLAVAPGIRG